ncbi:hypothetical protein AB6805_22845 [Chitinophaga sp. RCC_12]|uniref:hypothetical protein n=1 Tax=Chitinophaga sp. RCC_12 TaxID=3239226 RepID=UPI003526970F
MKLTSILKCILFVPALIIAGCGKDKNRPTPPPDKNCRIATIATKSASTTTTYTLSYDNDGRVSKMVSDDFYKTSYIFNYAPGLITRNSYSDHWNGQLTAELRAELNSMGLPTLIVRKGYDYTPAGQPLKLETKYTFTYEYNSQGELQLSTEKYEYFTNPASNSTTTTTYTWANGNLVKDEATGGATSNYEYYTDKPMQKGDPSAIGNLINKGISPIKNKNLIKSSSNGTVVINVNYEYDETGKIKTAALTGNTAANSSEMRYQYSCN